MKFNVKAMGIQWLVDRMHVGTSDYQVAKQFFQRIRRSETKFTKSQKKEIVRFALECHKKNRQLYRDVMGGF